VSVAWLPRREPRMAVWSTDTTPSRPDIEPWEVGAPAPTPPVGLVSRVLNELIFPVGCAAVVYASNILGKRPK
jgi:hypothetical protein